MSAHNVLTELYNAPFLATDPGDAKALRLDRWNMVFPLVTAGAETRTLDVPTKAGLLVTLAGVTLAGACTITVASAFTEAGTTDIVLSNAGEAITLISVPVAAGTYAWRVLSHTGVAALTAADAATIDTTYGSQESGVLENIRTRVGEIETALKKAGILI